MAKGNSSTGLTHAISFEALTARRPSLVTLELSLSACHTGSSQSRYSNFMWELKPYQPVRDRAMTLAFWCLLQYIIRSSCPTILDWMTVLIEDGFEMQCFQKVRRESRRGKDLQAPPTKLAMREAPALAASILPSDINGQSHNMSSFPSERLL